MISLSHLLFGFEQLKSVIVFYLDLASRAVARLPSIIMSNCSFSPLPSRQIFGTEGGENMEEKEQLSLPVNPTRLALVSVIESKYARHILRQILTLLSFPLRRRTSLPGDTRKPRVCGYCRVSTETEEQQGSFEPSKFKRLKKP